MQRPSSEQPVTLSQDVPGLPERPSVSVLPFVNLGDDPSQEYFADGLTEDLITDLSRVASLFVIARNSSFDYKNRSVDVRQVGRELGVRYLVEGNVRKVGDQLRINVKLVDVSSGEQLWGERFDGHLGDLFDFQEAVTDGITETLAVSRTRLEKDYAAFRETHAIDAYEHYLKGSAAFLSGTPESLLMAIGHLERALEADPGYGRALATMAAVYWEIYRNRWHRRLGISPNTMVWQRADDFLARSMIAPTALAHKVASEMLTFNRRYEQALSEAELAIALDPNAPQGYIAMAEVKTFMGLPDEALSLLHKAMRLDPRGHPAYLFAQGKAQLAMGSAAEAAAAFEAAVAANHDNRLARMGLLSAYGILGESERAAEALAGLEALQARDQMLPFSVTWAHEFWPFQHDADREMFLDGLRSAGVKEW
jgi:TolB-like protein/Flp pilus assembly protein TadD